MNAPVFSLATMLENKEVSLDSFLGKPVMLTFWASWCPDCHRDLQLKNQFYRSINSDQLVFLTINVTGREGNPDDGVKFIKENHYSFPVLKDLGTKMYDAYQCMGVPTTILLNKDHEIVERFNDKASFTAILGSIGKII
ncbi:TlpA family protein disulfide reductase [Anaerobacillus alkaliphilus]|uniref:TlpA family protein disulfide reductase n=1 Tax=Anaerobacillus alkaliphilus TaxID=1548597 RepID=A0A4Q0VWB9_9BACI|nr:TlpA disulfide reductase family protein [Anaerobacillus alkaliphilus]RXJ04003.1 TlpA family protein disulfide reductase [Anaerobacillus alkaliphilus]